MALIGKVLLAWGSTLFLFGKVLLAHGEDCVCLLCPHLATLGSMAQHPAAVLCRWIGFQRRCFHVSPPPLLRLCCAG